MNKKGDEDEDFAGSASVEEGTIITKLICRRCWFTHAFPETKPLHRGLIHGPIMRKQGGGEAGLLINAGL